jgi:uroporphyrinogen decarboxylase
MQTMMMTQPKVLHALLDHLADALAIYASYQIKSGAQMIQLFDSWAHHLSPSQFSEFSLPYAQRVIRAVRRDHPDIPLIFHANGGVGKLAAMAPCSADVLGLDWNTDMAEARAAFPNRVLQGNVDPMALFGSADVIEAEVAACLAAGGPGKHILNVGHGVVQGTPEESVKLFVHLARQSAREPELVIA